MKVKYLGPRDAVNVEPYGPHKKNEVKEYPGDFARELLATSVKQRFEAVSADAGSDHEMTVPQLKNALIELEVEVPASALKADLVRLYEEAQKAASTTETEDD